jgi:prepilin-type N-terminal cleavage/methylation domain-containing protein
MIMRNNESGFSLLELSISIAIMGIMIGVVVPDAYNRSMVSAQESSLKGDLATVMTGLQGYHLENPSTQPQPQEFITIKEEVLADYVATPVARAENQTYLNSIQYVKIGKFYCVEGSKQFGNTYYTMHYDSLAGQANEGPCPTNELGISPN